ncbi:MAG: VOC family protein [Patescibacteria group bacterium]
MNKVSHFEVPVEDLKEAQKFYGEVFGWQFKPWSEDYVSVRTVKSDSEGKSTEVGGINGGLQKKGPRAKSVTFVMEVDDIDKTLEDIESRGGSIAVPKEKMGDMGFYAQFEDPEGNRLGLFQSLEK